MKPIDRNRTRDVKYTGRISWSNKRNSQKLDKKAKWHSGTKDREALEI